MVGGEGETGGVMELEEAIYGQLVGNATVGGLVSTRVYPLMIPQEVALPAIAYQRISGMRALAHDGEVGFAEARVQFTCQAESYDGAKDLARGVRLCLAGFNGVMGGSAAKGVRVQGVRTENEMDGWGMVAGHWTVRLDMMFWYLEGTA